MIQSNDLLKELKPILEQIPNFRLFLNLGQINLYNVCQIVM